MKYFAYGMNTNLSSMMTRCPNARSLGRAVLPNYSFAFKSHATVIPEMGKTAHGVLWEITPECEKALDHLEGYPVYYNKINVWVEHDGELVPAMTYLMYPDEPDYPPSDSYVNTVREGYRAHGVHQNQIDQALKSIYDFDFWLTNQEKEYII